MNSANSDTHANDEPLRKACAEAVEELRSARKLLAGQNIEIQKQAELLVLEKQISSGLKNLRSLDAQEKQELRNALAAKDKVIAGVEAQNVILKKQRFTIWKAFKVAVVAVGAGFIVGVLTTKK